MRAPLRGGENAKIPCSALNGPRATHLAPLEVTGKLEFRRGSIGQAIRGAYHQHQDRTPQTSRRSSTTDPWPDRLTVRAGLGPRSCPWTRFGATLPRWALQLSSCRYAHSTICRSC